MAVTKVQLLVQQPTSAFLSRWNDPSKDYAMRYFRDIEEGKLIASIRNNYDFLADEFGFHYSSKDSREHHYKTDRCRISIYYYRRELNIYISPIDDALIQARVVENFPSKDVGIEVWEILDDKILKDNGIEFLDLNRQVLRNQIEAGKPIEYTLRGIPDNQIPNELFAIETLRKNNGSKEAVEEVKNLLEPDELKFPFRLEEVKLLIQSGYEYKFVGDKIYWTKDLLNFSP